MNTTKTETNDQVPISKLQPNIYNTVIIGLIISKQGPKTILSKRDPGKQRSLLSLTIRDSPNDIINATCWGDEAYIQEIAKILYIGEVVEIKNSQIQTRIGDYNEERYNPMSTSKYQLNISQNHSSIAPYGGDTTKFWQLNHTPTKPSNDIYPLADIIFHGDNLHGEHINILAAIKSVSNVKEVITKQGKHLNKLDLRVFDQTSMNFHITIWDDEHISLATQWIPGEFVIFFADLRIYYNSFKKCMTGVTDSRTIFTINPDTDEARSLFDYAISKKQEFQDSDCLDDGNMSLQDIKDIYTIEEIKKKLYDKDNNSNFYGIIYAFITSLDIDGITSVVQIRCEKCRQQIQNSGGQCVNPQCPIAMGAELSSYEKVFSHFISISDHTGSMHRCRISGKSVEMSIGCSADNFFNMIDGEKTALKWKYLMERCTIAFKAMSDTLESENPVVRILNFGPTNIEELLRN